MTVPVDALGTMMLIRAFETALAARPDRGFQLPSSGGEAVAVGLCSALGPADQLLTGGRSLGLALARGVDPRALMAEILGRTSGPNRGRAGRGHLSDPERGFFGAHSVVGGNIAVAAGVALSQQMGGGSGIAAVVFGDGACGAGVLHETLNIAALWKLPLLLVCENNQWAVSTPRSAGLAPRQLSDLARPFGIDARTVDGLDLEAVAEASEAAVNRIRAGEGPAFIEMISIRLGPHSSGSRESRDRAELAVLAGQCPIRRQAERLRALGGLSMDREAWLRLDAARIVAEALAFAEASPFPGLEEIVGYVC